MSVVPEKRSANFEDAGGENHPLPKCSRAEIPSMEPDNLDENTIPAPIYEQQSVTDMHAHQSVKPSLETRSTRFADFVSERDIDLARRGDEYEHSIIDIVRAKYVKAIVLLQNALLMS